MLPGNQPKPTHHESDIGAGYYAFRHITSQAGKLYTKLVKRDKSNQLNPFTRPYIKPSTGHNQRRQAILDKRKVA